MICADKTIIFSHVTFLSTIDVALMIFNISSSHANTNSSKKGLINIQNQGNECFLWCHIRH